MMRDEFRAAVFARDGQKCVACGVPALDAHHLLERRLWADGGYHLDNGVSVCGPCHILAEQTVLSCETLREMAKITAVLLPEHLYADQSYTKWGDPILPNGQRMRGELFDDPSVQKILESVLHLYTTRVRHPRTHHLPWSPGLTDDDKMLASLNGFLGQPVVVTVKLDGEQCTMYDDYLHARSPEYHAHPSRDWVKALHARVKADIPSGWRLCGENLFAKHSIHYHGLASYFFVHSIWNDHNVCLEWDETTKWAELLDLQPVPELWRGTWNEEIVRGLHRPTFGSNECEGYVVRVVSEFPYRDYRRLVGKYVRLGHVQTHGHWLRDTLIKNGLERS